MRYVNRDNKDNTRRWAARLKDKSGMNKAVVAVAHKTTKVMYAVMRDGTVYRQKKLPKSIKLKKLMTIR